MSSTIILGIFAVSFAFLAKYKNFRYGLEISFFLIFLFLALRYNFGNDYKAYSNLFNKINLSYTNLFDESVYGEVGWKILCRLFKPLGFFAMTAIIAFFSCLVYYRFVTKYVPLKYYWFAVFLYIFNPAFLLTHLSAMRQNVSIILFILSLEYLFKKDAFRYILCIAIATLFHMSAIVLIPVYFLTFLNQKISVFFVILLFTSFSLLFYFGKYLLPNINDIVSKYFPRYLSYEGGTFISTGLGVLFLTFLFILTLYFSRFQKGESSLLFKLATISFFFIPLSISIMELGRINMYFEVAILAVYPIFLNNSRNRYLKIVVAIFIIIVTLHSFFQFFHSAVYSDYYRTYQTILSAS